MTEDRERIDEGELSTADLVETRPRHQAEDLEDAAAQPAGDAEAEAVEPLCPGDEADDLRGRWNAIQAGFVDEPRRAVEEADGLVAKAIKRVAETFADERAGLESQWDSGDDVSTEDLRLALGATDRSSIRSVDVGRRPDESDRYFGRILDLPQSEVARRIGDAGMGKDAAHDEAVIVGDVPDCDAQQIVPLARHGIAFDDLGARLDELLELGARFDRLAGHPHLAQDVDAAAEPLGIGEPHRRAEHIFLLQVAHPPPDGSGRRADPLGQRRVAQARVALQFANDSPVDLVELIHFCHQYSIR